MQYLGELGAEVKVVRNDAATVAEVAAMGAERIVISPGPGRPEDAGITMAVIRELGHRRRRSSACASGIRRWARCSAARSCARACRCTARRRRSSTTAAVCSPASAEPFLASRYHSLVVSDEGFPTDLEVTARTREDGAIMGLRHRHLPVHGVQFHPESILTGEGHRMLRNFLEGRAD